MNRIGLEYRFVKEGTRLAHITRILEYQIFRKIN
jgi:hypothetical protein